MAISLISGRNSKRQETKYERQGVVEGKRLEKGGRERDWEKVMSERDWEKGGRERDWEKGGRERDWKNG